MDPVKQQLRESLKAFFASYLSDKSRHLTEPVYVKGISLTQTIWKTQKHYLLKTCNDYAHDSH
jgi:hypothetical protein